MRLFVCNLHYQLEEQELREIFEKIGALKDLRLIGNRGFGFVEFQDALDASRAIDELDNTIVRGRRMRVFEAREKDR